MNFSSENSGRIKPTAVSSISIYNFLYLISRTSEQEHQLHRKHRNSERTDKERDQNYRKSLHIRFKDQRIKTEQEKHSSGK